MVYILCDDECESQVNSSLNRFCHKARFFQACPCFRILSWSYFFGTKKIKQLSKVVNCCASPESVKMNIDDTFLEKKKSMLLQIWLQKKHQKRVHSTHTGGQGIMFCSCTISYLHHWGDYNSTVQ